MKEVVYAVYFHQGGRWVRERSYNSDQRDMAQQAARAAAAKKGVLGATLVRETFDPDTKATEEVGVFSQINNKAVPALNVKMVYSPEPQHEAGSTADDRGVPDEDDDEMPDLVVGPAQPRGSSSAVVSKLVMAFILAGVVAGGISFLLGRVGGYGLFESLLGPQGLAGKVFGILFFVTLLVIVAKTIRWREFSAAFSAAPSGDQRRRPAARSRARTAGRRRAEERPPRDSRQGEGGGGTGAAGDGAAATAPQEGAEAGGVAGASLAEAEAPAPAPELGPEGEEAKKSVMTFFALCLEFLGKTDSKFLKRGKLSSSYNHFGADLFLAGAAEAYGELKGMADASMSEVMAACVESAGRDRNRASEFAKKYEGYLMEPKYLEMFRSGRDAMMPFQKDEELRAKAAAGELEPDEEAMLDGESETDIGIFFEGALDEWNSKKEGPASGGTVAIMFTYVVPLGEVVADEQAKRHMDAHNRIAREALRRYGQRSEDDRRRDHGVLLPGHQCRRRGDRDPARLRNSYAQRPRLAAARAHRHQRRRAHRRGRRPVRDAGAARGPRGPARGRGPERRVQAGARIVPR